MEISFFVSVLLIVFIAGVIFISLLPVNYAAYLASAAVFLMAVISSIPSVYALSGNLMFFSFDNLPFFGTIELRIDPLAAWFILIINFTSVTGSLYGIGYMGAYSKQKANITMHWILFLLFYVSMVMVCMVQNSLAFLIVWEIMSLSSLLLVIFEHTNNRTLKAGINYLVQMHIGVVLLAMGFIWVYIEQGSYSFESIGLFFKTYPGSWLFFIFLAGFGIKAGFIPLHSWLPHAHPAAPAHISGIMSGVMVKLGIYGILRTISLVSNNFSSLGEVILIVSVLTGIYGISNAAVHRDIKKMLAYCTVENIGIIGIGIGLGLIGQDEGNILLVALGYGGALLHVLNHSLYKSLLFYTAGSVYQQTHTRDMEKLGGLIKHMPHTALVYLLGALAICGLPPLNGFISEFFLYSGLIEGIRHSGFYHIILITLALAGLAIVGGMALLAFTKNFGILFLGQQRTDSHADYTEVKPVRRVPYYMILLIMVSIGLFPAIFITKALTVVTVTFNLPFNWNSELLAPSVKLMSNIGICSAFFIGLICSVSAVRFFITRKKQKNISATWGCGYVAPKVSMQYTGKSFIKPFAKIPGGLIPEIKKYEALEVQEIFPEKRKFFSHFADFFENKIIIKITKPLLAALNVFQFVQNGRIQFYLLYGLVFIVIVLVGTFFNFI